MDADRHAFVEGAKARTAYGSRLKGHGSGLTASGPRLTAQGFRLTAQGAHGVQRAFDLRLKASGSRLRTRTQRRAQGSRLKTQGAHGVQDALRA
jgi:hypothetical protein